MACKLCKMCFKSTYFNQNKGFFQVEESRVSKFCRLALFFAWRQWQTASIHSSRSNKWFISFSQLANDTKWHTVLHCKHENATKNGARCCCLKCLMSKLTLLYTHGLITTCLNFLAFYQIHHGCREWDPPHFMRASLHTKMLKKSVYGVGCWN